MADGDTIVSAWNQDQQQQTQGRNTISRRVCVACRRRKVGCNKKQPCQHCKKSGTDCVYPTDSENGDRQLDRDTQLLEQLHRLEPIFKTLADCMEQGTLPVSLGPSSSSSSSSSTLPNPSLNKPPPPSPPTPPQSVGSTSLGHIPGTGLSAMQQTPSPQSLLLQDADSIHPNIGGSASQEPEGLAWSPYGTSTGKLVMDDGRQRYVSGKFWEALHTENDDDEAMVSDAESDLDGDATSASVSLQYALIFNSCTQQSDSDSLQPPQHQRLRAWQLFKANVHPVATILHIPSIEPRVIEAMQKPQDLAPSLEALLFVVYFGAANSLSADDCQLQFQSPQSTLLTRFRRGADSAFARSQLMETDDLLTLQILVVYLVLLRSRDPTYSWNMTGLAVRLAQSLGVHRDGSTLNLGPFETEMRRRLWWSICILDTPASEDYSCSTGLLELSSSDAKPPLNVNDVDLYVGMTEFPGESQGMTDMSFTVARCWASNIWRTMIDTRRLDPVTGKSFKSMTVTEKQAWVDRQRQHITSRFSGDKTSRGPLHCLVTTFVGTIISNLRLMVINPLESEDSLTDDQRRRAFRDAIDCMTYSYRLRTGYALSHCHTVRAVESTASEGCRQGMEGGGAERSAEMGLIDQASTSTSVALGYAKYRQGQKEEEKGVGSEKVSFICSVFLIWGGSIRAKMVQARTRYKYRGLTGRSCRGRLGARSGHSLKYV
ncbi:hypothetical protein FSARC_7626 [Fusarium sarcochroum]|uniref:Zn(2)-C6 fungal-type domain-containing protein n=1 Tax=Fusarium sarcochroum TaxID=1208366 RepID=A0A8H4TUR3_9HYPO|nr:hypothetical protein FSARC_7626 [Fusarium sarcochroum]